MLVIASDRQTGKTTKLIQKAAEDKSTIVCHCIHECERVYRLAKDLGYKIPYPISVYEFVEGNYYPRGCGSILIDNAELVLQSISRVPIHGITVTMQAD